MRDLAASILCHEKTWGCCGVYSLGLGDGCVFFSLDLFEKGDGFLRISTIANQH